MPELLGKDEIRNILTEVNILKSKRHSSLGISIIIITAAIAISALFIFISTKSHLTEMRKARLINQLRFGEEDILLEDEDVKKNNKAQSRPNPEYIDISRVRIIHVLSGIIALVFSVLTITIFAYVIFNKKYEYPESIQNALSKDINMVEMHRRFARSVNSVEQTSSSVLGSGGRYMLTGDSILIFNKHDMGRPIRVAAIKGLLHELEKRTEDEALLKSIRAHRNY
ncbi:hypothetical protein NEAUS04_0322 [Nematocida ausubeli]|nr:hypothetical protein NEAUS07_1154 [Nematocida ausubeli]KAI5146759.1 hypothetical protein NEAUS05_0198 [Nematocida ausubeli]KAI5146774.1 hypothetical protein NEAUS05_0213 [Nematocida ausubeli]KAI5161131.1 hypothetical protein NEAUS04_0307 [Nematocida ausubeli]KAI5161146.1 hypothetical protein NEAUS04_0322 [Nematocida ausubeli]